MGIESWIKIWRTGFLISFIGATQFLICCLIAIVLYPGGTIKTKSTSNYSLSQNYLSDLGREVSLSGKDNETGAKIFNGSLILLGLCSLPFFIFMPTHAYDKVGWLTCAAVFGTTASICLITMGASPADTAVVGHHVALFFWIVCIFFAASIHALCMLSSKEDYAMWLSLISVGVAMLAAAYIYHGTETAAAVVFRREIPLKSVLLQKLLVISTLIWLFAFSAKLLLTTDFSEFFERNIGKETDEYIKELEEEKWVPTRK